MQWEVESNDSHNRLYQNNININVHSQQSQDIFLRFTALAQQITHMI